MKLSGIARSGVGINAHAVISSGLLCDWPSWEVGGGVGHFSWLISPALGLPILAVGKRRLRLAFSTNRCIAKADPAIG